MADLHFVLLIMSTIEIGGYFSQDNEVERMIEKYNEEYPNASSTYDRVVAALKKVEDLKIESDSMWFRKSNFFTLVSELSLHPGSVSADLEKHLKELEEEVMGHRYKPETEFGEYYSYMYQGTNNRKARIVRSDLFRKYCFI